MDHGGRCLIRNIDLSACNRRPLRIGDDANDAARAYGLRQHRRGKQKCCGKHRHYYDIKASHGKTAWQATAQNRKPRSQNVHGSFLNQSHDLNRYRISTGFTRISNLPLIFLGGAARSPYFRSKLFPG